MLLKALVNSFIIKSLLILSLIFFIPINLVFIFLYFVLILFFIRININNIINYYLYFNIDIISISLIILRLWILILIMLRQFNINYINSLYFIFFILNLRLILSFLTTNIIIFYFFFEWSLIPIFFIIIGWGYQLERLKSRFILLMYTLFASLPLFIIILIIRINYYLINFNFLIIINFINLNNFYFLIIFLSFLIKFPIFFIHQWLPKAHVEAPVRGSIILAGVLLKLGGYGIIRLLFFLEKNLFIKIIMIFSLLGGRILRIVCLINRDIKVIIAYSSVVHIALIIINLFSKNFWSINGGIIMIISHGLCSSGIFSCANIFYERSHSRIIIINKNNLNYIPRITIFWFILCIANFGGPFTYNLLREIILIIRLSFINVLLLLFIIFISFFSAVYRLILYSNIQQGTNNNLFFLINNINIREKVNIYSHIWILLFFLLSPILI